MPRFLMSSLVFTVVLSPLACGPAHEVSGNSSEALSTCSLPSMFLVGSPRNFGVSASGSGVDPKNALPMTCNNGKWQVDELFAGTGTVFHAGAFKFVQTGDFSTGPSWGDNPPADGVADLGGDENDIKVDQPGNYTVTFDDNSLQYSLTRKPSSCSNPSMFLRGTFNGWGTQSMFCVGNGQWAAIAMFIGQSEQYKLDALGDWSSNWGDNEPDGVADPNGANIAAPGSGRFLVTFDESSSAYSLRAVSPACAWPTMFVRGTFDNWQPFAMECENGHYAVNLDGGGSGIDYKFDALGDWSLNWGEGGNFQAVQNGPNIHLVGKHHVHFYNDARFAYDTHQ